VAGVKAGVGNPRPIPKAVLLISNPSTVRGSSMVSTSATGSPVEMPKGKVIWPAVIKADFLRIANGNVRHVDVDAINPV
jgi:hypothetical protein